MTHEEADALVAQQPAGRNLAAFALFCHSVVRICDVAIRIYWVVLILEQYLIDLMISPQCR
jgi:hypothetical protein